VPDLEHVIEQVIETVVPFEREVTDQQGRWFSMQIRPYKNVENRIDGAVIALYDVNAVKRHEDEVRTLREFSDAVIETVRQPLVVLDGSLRVQKVNDTFCETFRVSAVETQQRLLYEIGNGQWNIPKLREVLGDVLPKHRRLENFAVEHEFPSIGRRSMILSARSIEGYDGSGPRILLAISDRGAGSVS
jgi:two-component system CheB/CheR fusion protein